jgi:DNA-binding NarL/FixJ family response regulator
MAPIRIVVVDDHEIVRVGITALLSREDEVQVVGAAATAEEGLALIREVEPDIAVVDYSLPGMSGVELCERVTVRFPKVAVILLTTFLDDDVIMRALEAGARAYVYKDVEAVDLKRAIRTVARGEAVLDPKIAGRVAAWAHRRRFSAHDEPLSLRETEVLRLVTRGASNKEIATELYISENTVKTYLKRVLTKLDCHSRSEAAAVASRRGLL